MNSTRRSLAIALQALGTCADDVADVLASGGWHGFRYDPIDCPVSIYLGAVVPDLAWAAVSDIVVTVETTNGDRVRTDLTPGVAEFVTAFDDGDYPDLAAVLCDTNGDVIDADS